MGSAADLLRALATDHGLLGTLLTLAIVGLIYLTIESKRKDHAHRRELGDLMKERLAETKELLPAIADSTRTLEAAKAALASTLSVMNDLGKGFAGVVSKIDEQKDHAINVWQVTDRRIEKIASDLEAVLRRTQQ